MIYYKFCSKTLPTGVVVHSPWGSQKGTEDHETMENQSSSVTDDNHMIDIHDSSDEELPGQKHGGQLISKNSMPNLSFPFYT